MLATSNDILNLVLSICVAVLTFFLCWAIYYFVASVQKIHKIVNRVEKGVNKAEEILEMAKDKLKNSSTYFMILGEIAKKAMEFVQEKREKKREKKAAKKK
jgi:5,10-methenyltetrahydromethanopterin hydrogenase